MLAAPVNAGTPSKPQNCPASSESHPVVDHYSTTHSWKCLIDTWGMLRGVPVASRVLTGWLLKCLSPTGVGFLTRCLPVGVLDRGVARKRREHTFPNQVCPLRSPYPSRKGERMSVMIGIDPHKGSHTAVVINGDEIVIEEIRVRASAR